MRRTLVSWIGGNDLKAVGNEPSGPILSTLLNTDFDSVDLLYAYPREEVEHYLSWLKTHISVPVNATEVSLSSPVDFGEIYLVADPHLSRLASTDAEISILLSPGTPAMQAVWILLGKTRYAADFCVFQTKVATDSRRSLPPIPRESCH